MPRTPIKATNRTALLTTSLGPVVRALTLAGATLTTGPIATMQAINERIQNPAFFLSFFGAVFSLFAALVAHSPQLRSGRFWLIGLACALYIGGGFLPTVFVNVPLNEQFAGVAVEAFPGELVRARAAYEDPWNYWNGVCTAYGVLVSGVSHPNRYLPAARC